MKNTANRFVAFIDILGFKNLVDSQTHSFVYNKLYALIDSIKEIHDEFGDEVKIWTFSDSILIVSKDDSEDCADSILFNTSALVTKSINLGLLSKGAVAYGNFTSDFENSIFFGKPLIDAYQLQEEMKVSSIIIHHTCEKKLKTMKYKETNLLEGGRTFEYNTPMKFGFVKHMHLNWLEYYSLFISENSDKEFKSYLGLVDKMYLDVSGSARQYLDNTLLFLNKCKDVSDKEGTKVEKEKEKEKAANIGIANSGAGH
jgi:hypothetical protein